MLHKLFILVGVIQLLYYASTVEVM